MQGPFARDPELISVSLSGSEKNSKPRHLPPSRPHLLARIEAGELSAHAAAIEAGIRRPMRSVPIDSPDNAIRAFLRLFTVADLAFRGWRHDQNKP